MSLWSIGTLLNMVSSVLRIQVELHVEYLSVKYKLVCIQVEHRWVNLYSSTSIISPHYIIYWVIHLIDMNWMIIFLYNIVLRSHSVLVWHCTHLPTLTLIMDHIVHFNKDWGYIFKRVHYNQVKDVILCITTNHLY